MKYFSAKRERTVMKELEIKGHKIKILKDSQGIPLKIFLDDKEVIGADKIEIKYSYDCCNRKKVQKISLRLIDFESLEVISQNV
jgi:hypothetical protein